MGERFCRNCKAIDKQQQCFGVEVYGIAKNELKSPEEKSMEIANSRERARNNCCPEINDINPNYPGKEKI